MVRRDDGPYLTLKIESLHLRYGFHPKRSVPEVKSSPSAALRVLLGSLTWPYRKNRKA